MSRLWVAIAVRVAVAVAVIAGTIGVARWMFGCSPPRDQADMITLYQADPLFAVVPAGGELVGEYAHSNACDTGRGGSPRGPAFAEVKTLYRTPIDITGEQLKQQFDRPAVAAGWRINPTEQDIGSYCKQTGQRASYASISATKYQKSIDEPLVPAVEVLLAATSDSHECFSQVR